MWSEQVLNIKLVGEIEKRPALYNYNLIDYSQKDVTERAWDDVGKQVGMTGTECKERWKNLRAVFIRQMKSAQSGFATKKPYYLTEAMQFSVPYIKTLCTSSGNLPQHRNYVHASDNKDLAKLSQPSSPPPSPRPPTPPNPPTPPVQPQQKRKCSDPSPQPPPKHDKKQIVVVRNNIVDNIKFLEAKKAKLSMIQEGHNSTNTRSEGLKMFLLSMLPDLESMTDVQVRQFKQRCLQVIDEILLPPPNPCSSPESATMLPSHLPSPSDNSSIP